MSWILFRYVLRTYLALFVGLVAGLLAIYLVVDFIDRARIYTGPHWVAEAAELYGYKALVAFHQLGPAALLLAGGTTVSLLHRRGEVTALGTLAQGPLRMLAPIALGAALLSAGLAWFGEAVAVDAGRKVNEVSASRFNRWTTDGLYFVPQRWFHRGDFVFYLREGDVDRGFEEVTLLRLDSEFRLTERIDAHRMVHAQGTFWRLSHAADRTFAADGATHVEQVDSVERDLGTTDEPFRIRLGAPEQMHAVQLWQQVRARRAAGLDAGPFSLALHNRLAYPFAGLPAALLAALLALTLDRKTTLALALAQGLTIAFVLWALMVVCRTLVTAHSVPAGWAAWAPAALLALGAGALWLHREGFFPSRLRGWV